MIQTSSYTPQETAVYTEKLVVVFFKKSSFSVLASKLDMDFDQQLHVVMACFFARKIWCVADVSTVSPAFIKAV